MASTASSTTLGTEESRRGRKQLRRVDEWTRKKRKCQKDKGEVYTTYKGEQKAAKTLTTLTCRCAWRCCETVSVEEQERLFKNFYALGSHDVQNKYLYGLISKKIRRRTRGVTTLETMPTVITFGCLMGVG